MGLFLIAAHAAAVDTAVVNHGNEKLSADDFDGAIEVYEQIIETDPDERVMYNLGVARFRKGDLAGARVCIRQSDEY